MRSMTKKCIAILTALFITVSLIMPVFAQISDISDNWAKAEIIKWTEEGIINGYPDGTFRPQKSITRAEFVAIVGRVFKYIDTSKKAFDDVSKDKWYAADISKAFAAGIITGDNSTTFRPDAPISRQEAALILYRAFNLKVKNPKASESFSDSAEIPNWSRDAISALFENGYVTGRPGNKFAPKANITRAEAVKMIDNIVEKLINEPGTFTGEINGNLVVNTADVVLKDMVINGDLYLAHGIGEGSVTLDGVTVKGRTVVMGGGENSIILNNTSLQGLIIIKQDGKIRVVAKGDTSVASVVLNSGAKLQTEELTGEGFGEVEIIEVPAGESIVLDGDFEKVVVAAADIEINVTGGKVENFEIAPEAEGAEIQIAGSATINTLTAKAAVEVKGTGKITTANIEAENVTIEPKPAKVVLGENVESAKIGGETVTESTPTVIIPGGVLPSPTVNVTGIKVEYSTDGGTTWTYTDSCVDGGTISLSSEAETVQVRSIHVTANQSGTMVLKSLKDSNNVILSIPSALLVPKPLPEVSIEDLVGGFLSGGDGVSLKTLRGIFGNKVVITGTINADNGATRDVSFTLELGGSLNPNNEWVSVDVNDSTKVVTATIKSGKESTPLKDIHVYQILSAAGSVPYSVTIGGTEYITSVATPSEIANAISNNNWGSWNLGQLRDYLTTNNITITTKKTQNGDSYTLKLQ